MRARFMVILSLGLISCAKTPSISAPAAAASEDLDAAVHIEKADALWSQRAEEDVLQEILAAYELAFAADPTSRHALVRLTRGWYFWGDAFSEDKDTKVERWSRALEFGNACVGLNSAVAQQLASGTRPADAIGAAEKEDVGCIYWTATALGKWGKIQSLSKTLKHLPTVKAYVAKAEELDPTYYHYGPARYWAAYYAALPSFAGQDYEKSASYFDAAIEAAPYYLPTRVLRAEYLAVGTQDVSLFDTDLAAVIQADPNGNPDAGITAENIKDIEKAKKLVAKRAEFFDKQALENAQ